MRMEVEPLASDSTEHHHRSVEIYTNPKLKRRTQAHSVQNHHTSGRRHLTRSSLYDDGAAKLRYDFHHNQLKKHQSQHLLQNSHHQRTTMSSTVKINEKTQDLNGSVLMIDKPLHAMGILLLLIPLTLSTFSSAQRINLTTIKPSSPSDDQLGRLGYKDTGLPIINGNPVDTNLSSIDAIVNSAFDDVSPATNNINSGIGDRNFTTPRDEGVIENRNTSSGGTEADGGFTMGLRTINTGINSDIPPPEDKQRTLEVVRQAHQNLLEPVIKTNKSNAFLSCETGEMIVKINFTEPFRGVAYADYDRSSPCKFFGDGSDYYEMRLPLKGCGTKQEAPRLFLNNIIVRYHRLLELEEDEIKTIVCRYPPPQAPLPPPPPVGPPERIIDAPPEPAKLTQYEPLVIIAGLLFFTLMMLGLGAGSYLIKRRNIKPVHTPLPPPPLTGLTEHETYLDNQSIITTEDINTIHKNTLFYAQPHLDTQYLDDTFVTTTHEIDTHDDIIHHTDTRYYKPIDIGTVNLEDSFITNQEELVTKDNYTLAKVAPVPKYLIKNIEDTFITKVDEIDETEQISTLHRKKLKKQPPTSTTDETIMQLESRQTTTDTNFNTLKNKIVPRPIKSNLTTTEQFKHLQVVVDIFNQTHTYSRETTSQNHLSDKIKQKFRSKIDRMPHYDRTTLLSLLTEDETFRSLIMDTCMKETLIPIIRQNPDYTNKLTVNTWDLFEEILEETNYSYKAHYYKSTEETSYNEESKAQIYEQIAQQQHYYNYDHIKQQSVGHISDPDFDSRTYTKSSDDTESRESLSPELIRRARRIKGRREQNSLHSVDYSSFNLDQDCVRPKASLLSDPDLLPQTFDDVDSQNDTASIPDYGDNLIDEPASLNSIQQTHQLSKPKNNKSTKDGYMHSYHNKAYTKEERQYHASAASYHDESEYGGYMGTSQIKESSNPSYLDASFNDAREHRGSTSNWIKHKGEHMSNPDHYDNEESYPVYTKQDANQESSSYGNYRSKKLSSHRKKNDQR